MRKTFADTLRDVRAGPHKVLEASFRETYARIAEQTQRTPLLGSPE